MKLPASRVPTAVDRRVSNFDQFFVGLPISLYGWPHRTSLGPRLAEDVANLVPVFPSRHSRESAFGVQSFPKLIGRHFFGVTVFTHQRSSVNDADAMLA